MGTIEFSCFCVYMFLNIFPIHYFYMEEYAITLLSSGFLHLTVSRRGVQDTWINPEKYRLTLYSIRSPYLLVTCFQQAAYRTESGKLR